MMYDELPLNPYHADAGDDPVDAPFAGRMAALGRLYQALTDPARRAAVLFLGGRRVGKTVLLHASTTSFGETFVPAYLALRDTPPEDDTDFALLLAQAATAELVERNFTLSRLTDMPPPDDNPHAWLRETFLPQVLIAIRPQRQLVFLLDDAEVLLNAVRGGRLAPDLFAILRALMDRHPQVGFALTLDSEYEDALPEFAPLVMPDRVVRLSNLTADETRWLLQTPARPHYNLPDEAAAQVYKATGGAPALVQQFGHALFRRWLAAPELNVLTVDDVKALTPPVYDYAGHDYRSLWGRLSLDERLVLTAISSLIYKDPLQRIDGEAVQSWLVDTDYPKDVTTIRAAVRSLEYREILAPTPGGYTIASGLLQSWLVENARLDRSAAGTLAEPARSDSLLTAPVDARLVLVGALLVLVIAVIAALGVFGGSDAANVDTPPTATLVDER